MILTHILLSTLLQANPIAGALPVGDGHEELRNRPPRGDAQSETDATSQWLTQCLALIEEDASRAHTMAQIKRNESSGIVRVLANHCLGLSATRLGLWEDGIGAFITARNETPSDQISAKARFGLMAGNAALASGDLAQAQSLLTQAKLDATTAASANLQAIAANDLARVLVSLNQNEAALAELEIATALAPQDHENWLLKATLLRRMDRLEEAQLAIQEASERANSNPQVGLEAGVIAVLGGREEAARSSWQSVIDIAPQDPAALIAQDYLNQLGPPPSVESNPTQETSTSIESEPVE